MKIVFLIWIEEFDIISVSLTNRYLPYRIPHWGIYHYSFKLKRRWPKQLSISMILTHFASFRSRRYLSTRMGARTTRQTFVRIPRGTREEGFRIPRWSRKKSFRISRWSRKATVWVPRRTGKTCVGIPRWSRKKSFRILGRTWQEARVRKLPARIQTCFRIPGRTRETLTVLRLPGEFQKEIRDNEIVLN